MLFYCILYKDTDLSYLSTFLLLVQNCENSVESAQEVKINHTHTGSFSQHQCVFTGYIQQCSLAAKQDNIHHRTGRYLYCTGSHMYTYVHLPVANHIRHYIMYESALMSHLIMTQHYYTCVHHGRSLMHLVLLRPGNYS